MLRKDLPDLAIFVAIVEAGSFTRTASLLGMSQSALSHALRRLEERLGLRLLTRSSRSLAPTEAGERLLAVLRPSFGAIEAELTALTALRERPAGRIRISSADHAAERIVWPAAMALMREHPEISVDLQVENELVDIVAGKFDAGVRLGDHVARDMIALPIGPPERACVVAAPDYLARHGTPRTPEDLAHHACISRSLPALGGQPSWRFWRAGQPVSVRVGGRLTLNRPELMIAAALAGEGVAQVLASQVRAELAEGRLVSLLADVCPEIPGYHLYYPMRRQHPRAFGLLVEKLRYRG